MTDLDIEFEHLYLEAKYQRWSLVPRFLFSYFCFREGYVTTHGKPDWEKARASCRRSTDASISKQVDLIPLVPLDTLVGEIKCLERDDLLSKDTLRNCLDDLLDYVVISKQEWQKMKNLGLEDRMPVNWYQSKTKDRYARLKAIGIPELKV
ncbi:hypothetical protein [Vibrio mexicanus]|uniref:hypothetical protein n=1 Tax=Vibrio mexicanus TaxID=1004326 RepID=UPI00063C6663|nr:hypothetical protein [Vibrio mexicanus]